MSGVRKRQGFTIIELITVIAIIALLAGLLFPAITKVQARAKIAKAQAMVDALTVAVKEYERVFGRFPPDDTDETEQVGLGTGEDPNVASNPWENINAPGEFLYFFLGARLIAGVNSPLADVSAGPFMEYKEEDLGTGGGSIDFYGDGTINDQAKTFLDPWGNPYVYDRYDSGVEDGTADDWLGSEDYAASHQDGDFGNKFSFDIWSLGPDGVNDDGGNDDIKNW